MHIVLGKFTCTDNSVQRFISTRTTAQLGIHTGRTTGLHGDYFKLLTAHLIQCYCATVSRKSTGCTSIVITRYIDYGSVSYKVRLQIDS